MGTSRFDWRKFIKEIAVIAIPVALQNLLTTTGSMVDTMMIAPLGQLSVGAIGLCAQFMSFLFSCYWGFVGGGMLFFAQYYGNRDHKGINRSYGMTFTCMAFVAVLFCVAAVFFPGVIMSIYTDKVEIQEIGISYLRIVGFAYPLQVYSMCMSALLRTTGKVRIPMYGALCSVATNIFMNWVLINGKFGLPAMGVQGAALATVIAAAVNVGVVLALALKQKHPYILKIREHFKWNKDAIREYLKKCAPIIANELLIGIGNMVVNMVLGRQSSEAIAATAVFRTFEGFVIGFFAGFSNAASVLVGVEVGAGHLELAYQRAKRLVYLCGSVICAVCLMILLVHDPLLRRMGLSGEAYDICFGMLQIYGVAAIIRMCNWAQNDTYRSAGDATYGTVLEIICMYVMVLPSVWLTGMVFHTPFLIVFACCYVDELLRFFLMQRHMFTGRWVKPVTPEGRKALHDFRMAHDPGYRKKFAAASVSR